MGLHKRQAAAMLLVLLTSYLAVRTSPGGAGVSEWWVASGIGACAMVTSPRRHAPLLFLGVAGLTWVGTTSAALEREREANVRMQSMDRAKNELISTISHELRTPLTSIVGYVELLEDGTDLPDEHRADLLGRVSRNADRLLALAKDVLRIAAVDERDWVPDKQLIDLRKCVLAAQDAAVIPAPRQDELKVIVEVPDEAVTVHADPQEIERVVFNFVSNAIKFSPGPGTVRVWLATLGGMARISVEDTGLGISRDDQKRIFERFFRSSIARQRAVPGTGLGLSIARSIAEAHGGAVGFLSEEGEGSTFWVDLPLAAGAAPR